MDHKRSFPLVLSSFWLKMIAILTMTLDHVGYLMQFYGTNYYVADIFRKIGRLALPLFCFMIVEGVIHTRSFKKYALRLGVMASVISISIIVLEYIPGMSMRSEGVIFLDLLLGALAVYCLKQEKWYFKLLAILPLGYGIASFVASSLEACGCRHILWLPYFMRTQYGWYGIALIIGFYVAYLLAKLFIKVTSQKTMIPEETYVGSNLERNAINIISVLVLGVVTVLLYFVNNFIPDEYQYLDVTMQLYAIISGVFILLYNGYRGYNKKWFQYGCYLYYAIHLPLIAAIFLLLNYLSVI